MKFIKSALKSLILCSIIYTTSLTPIFSENISDKGIVIQVYEQPTDLYKPGSYENIRFTIQNNSDKSMTVKKIYFIDKYKEREINLGKSYEEMDKYTKITIKEVGNDENQVSANLNEIIGENNGVNLVKSVNIKSNDQKEFTLNIDMDEDMNNDAQGISRIFSLGVTYNMEQTIKPPTDIEDSNDESGSDSYDDKDKLPQTGGIINSASLVVLGAIAIGTGIVLNKKSEAKGGDKYNE